MSTWNLLKSQTRFTSSGFNNENITAAYITQVINPWNQERDVDVVLTLDEASCHQTEKVINALKESGIFPLSIPAGSTRILQPLDVSINKPFKDKLRNQQATWMQKHVEQNKPFLIPLSVDNIVS